MPPRPFEGIIAIEGQLTGDGRLIDRGALRWEAGPWPVKFLTEDMTHSAPVVGEVTRIWRDGENIWGAGVLHTESTDTQTLRAVDRLIELLESGSVGVSIGLDDESVELRVKKEVWEEWQAEWEAWMNDEVPEPDDPETDADGRIVLERWAIDDMVTAFTDARIREVSVVDVAAFADAGIAVEPELVDDEGLPVAASIVLVDTIGLAASISIEDRARAFTNPNFGPDGTVDPRLVWQTPQRPEEVGGWGCPLTIDGDGALYGHATLRSRCHGSFAACMPPPDSGGDFSRFLVGSAVPGIATGPIILDTDHGITQGRVKSETWLADTGMAVADVTVGHDQHGLWVAGRVRPGLSDRELAALRGSTLSAEWHPIGGKLRLIGILAVNAPGYLVQRHGVAASFTIGAQCCTGEARTHDERLTALEAGLAYLMRQGV